MPNGAVAIDANSEALVVLFLALVAADRTARAMLADAMIVQADPAIA